MAAYYIQTSRKLEALLRGDKEASWIGELKTISLWRACGAEFLGTLLFVFVGCSAILSRSSEDTDSNKIIQIALAFGLGIMAMVMFTGHISGGHINPAVSIALAVAMVISPIRAALYCVSQVLGAVVGAAILKGTTDEARQSNLGSNGLTGISAAQGFGYELMITFILMSVIMGTTDGKRTTFAGVGIEIGLTVALCHLAGINFTGASMNPARSFGPAVISGTWKNHWVYWVGPIVGACLASLLYKYVLSPYRGVETVDDALKIMDGNGGRPKSNDHEMQTQVP